MVQNDVKELCQNSIFHRIFVLRYFIALITNEHIELRIFHGDIPNCHTLYALDKKYCILVPKIIMLTHGFYKISNMATNIYDDSQDLHYSRTINGLRDFDSRDLSLLYTN